MDIQTLCLTIGVVISFTAVLSYFSYRQKQSSWKGEITGKDYQEAETDEDGSTPERFILKIRTIEGKKISIRVDSKMYEGFSIGDKVEKQKGEYFPVKIS